MKKIKLFLVALSLICTIIPSVSAEMSDRDCKKAAENFLSYIGSDKEILSVKALEKDGDVIAYVMNLGQGGYLLVSVSESLVPIKSYSLTSPFDTLPQWYKEVVTTELGAVTHPEYRENARNENRDRWDFLLSYEKTRTSPRYTADTFLLKTQWNQSPVYNKALPEINGEHVVTGCVQTALGQIMKYHQYPEQAVGVLRHTWNNQNLKTILYKTYHWELMPDAADSGSPEYMQDEVAALMRDLGIVDRANFGLDETSASFNITALIENFGYSTELNIMKNDDPAFFTTIKSEIDSNRPLALNFPGHATVADGYASDPTGKKIHVNMGWGGHYDDFYFLNDTVNAGPYSFAPDLEIIHHIKPCKDNDCYTKIIEPELPDAIDSTGLKITGSFYAPEDADIYRTFLKGPTEISGNRGGYTNQAFYILVYAANDEIVASDDKTITLDLPAGKYWIKAALINEKGAYYSYDAEKDYTITISTQTVTEPEKTQIAAYNTEPVITNDFKDIFLTEPRKIRIDTADEDYRDEVSLSAESSTGDITAVIEGNILTLTPAVPKGHSKITVIASSGDKSLQRDRSVQKSFEAVVSDEPVYFGKQFVINGTFGTQDEFDKYKAILEGQCSIKGYNGYSNQAFFTSVIDAADGKTYLVPMGDKLIEYKAENKLYLLGASLKKYPGTSQYPYMMGKGDNYSLTVNCPDADTDISSVAQLLGIDMTASGDSVPVITGLSDDISPVKTKVWKWDASSENIPVTFRYQLDQNKTGVPSGPYSDSKTISKLSTTGGTWYLHVQAKDADGNESTVTTVSAVLLAATGPENDNFVNATVLTGESGQTDGSNTNATNEPAEPDHAGNKGGQSVWWKWTVPDSGYFSFDTKGSTVDTLLAVYTGSGVGSLTEIAANNDVSAGVPDQAYDNSSRVTFYAEKDKVCYIAVDGYGMTSGNITLNWKKADPESDNFNNNLADAASLSGESGTTASSTANADKEFGEPNHAENIGGKSVWYSWVAPPVKDEYSAYFSFDTHGSSFDTLLAVYTGTSPISLKLVADNDDDETPGNVSSLTFRCTGGTRYYIAVDGKDGASGNVVLNWKRLTASGSDNFADASELQWMAIASNVTATKETGEPNHAGNSGGKSLWWKGTAIEDGWFAFDTHGSDFDTLLSVYTGSAVAALTKIGENDNDRNDGTSGMAFHVEKGKTYYFAVDGNDGASGNILLNWRLAYPPANDNFANAIALDGPSGKTAGSNTDATKETGEPQAEDGEDIGGKSVWWKWTAPQTGTRYAFDTRGSDFDTTLAVYTGSGVNALTKIASNDDDKSDGNSGLSFAAEPGKNYYIAVDGYMGLSGNIVLNWRAASPPANDNFSNAVTLESAASGKVGGTNTDATEETGEPNHSNLNEAYSDRYGNTSVWWKWTAPKKDRFSFTAEGSEKFYKMIGIYTGSSLDSLEEVVSNSGEEYRNFVTFDAEANQTYYIAVDGYQGGTGMILLSWTIPPVGDADGSGGIDLKDALLIFKMIVGADTGSDTLSLTADVNGDGKLGIAELIYILKHLAG